MAVGGGAGRGGARMSALKPVELYHERDHVFAKPEIKPKRGKGRCAICGRRFGVLEHLGAPPSLNVGGSGSNHFAYQQSKHDWQGLFVDLLTRSCLPRGLAAVSAEAQLCFPDRIRRDQGNFRYLIEKALGDALVDGGWLTDDSFFPERRYAFGDVEGVYVKGQSWMRLMLFPRAADSSPILAHCEARDGAAEFERQAAA